MEVTVYPQSQQPCPVLGDILPVQTQGQLKSLLQGVPTERDKPSKAKQRQHPFPLGKAMVRLATRLELLKQEDRERLVFLDLLNDPMNLPWPESWVQPENNR